MVKFSKGHQDYNLEDNVKLYFGSGNDTEMYFNGTNQVLKSAGKLLMQLSGDTDDYLEFSTASNLPIIKAIGGSAVMFEADDAGNVGVFAREDATKAAWINYDKTNDVGEIGSTHDIWIQPNNVTTTGVKFTTDGNNDTAMMLHSEVVADNVELKADNGDLWITPSGNEVFISGAADSPYLKLWDGDSKSLAIQKLTAGGATIHNDEGDVTITAAGNYVSFGATEIDISGQAAGNDHIKYTASSGAPSDPVNPFEWLQVEDSGGTTGYIPIYR